MSERRKVQVFKFGGAALQDAEGFRNVLHLLKPYRGQPLVIVISALGKTTNALEQVVEAYFHDPVEALHRLQALKKQHELIALQLFDASDPVIDKLHNTFAEAEWLLEEHRREPYDYVYDQVVAVGELASSLLVARLLEVNGLETRWLDVRDLIITDDSFREANVHWPETIQRITNNISTSINPPWIVTQGFIAATSGNRTTTLGREGSDYSAAIFAHALDATSVTIWKDVPGVLNADPRLVPNAIPIRQLSYHEAIEMSYYGATVIHPKTIKPLQNKSIPLYVRSFVDAELPGTVINHEQTEVLPPIVVLKNRQVLLSIYPRDFSFITEAALSEIFSLLSNHRMRTHLMQQSAMSFSLCTDENERLEALLTDLRRSFAVRENRNLHLLTIRHYTEPLLAQLLKNAAIYLEQKSRHTVQIALQPPQMWPALKNLKFP
ncbi:MAG: aspartate kinase [Chitinophagales bacterium]|nr:aspartate kinase [Chitinophagales bacterium]MDW8427510.1 aspartate kinase [Chitinophagales bacterium]